jgi:hypothetical protein
MNLLPNLEPIWNIFWVNAWEVQWFNFVTIFFGFIAFILFQFFLTKHIILNFSIDFFKKLIWLWKHTSNYFLQKYIHFNSGLLESKNKHWSYNWNGKKLIIISNSIPVYLQLNMCCKFKIFKVSHLGWSRGSFGHNF